MYFLVYFAQFFKTLYATPLGGLFFALQMLNNISAADIYFFKVSNVNTRTMCKICSKLTIKTLEWRHWRRSGIFIVIFEQISHIALVFLLLTLGK